MGERGREGGGGGREREGGGRESHIAYEGVIIKLPYLYLQWVVELTERIEQPFQPADKHTRYVVVELGNEAMPPCILHCQSSLDPY